MPATARVELAARLLGALALLSVGAVHLQQYQKLYSAVPTIGPLFLVNFIVAALLGLALLVPVDRWAGRRGGVLVALAAAAGVGLANRKSTRLNSSHPSISYAV